jgi:hypothetical protein
MDATNYGLKIGNRDNIKKEYKYKEYKGVG